MHCNYAVSTWKFLTDRFDRYNEDSILAENCGESSAHTGHVGNAWIDWHVGEFGTDYIT